MGKIASRFGQVIRKRREAAGLSQEALAEEAGLHRTYVSLLERGERTPTLIVVKRLADALGTTMTSLVRELEAKTPQRDGDTV